MKSSRRVVFDTNTVVSALLIPDSKPRQAFDKALDQCTVLISIPVLAELNEVLSRKKFDKYLREDERKQFLVAFVREAEFVEITEEITDCRDPQDNKFLELAVCGNANCIISGDNDLLVMNPFRGISILQADVYLNQF